MSSPDKLYSGIIKLIYHVNETHVRRLRIQLGLC